jgi:hypothetical protein
MEGDGWKGVGGEGWVSIRDSGGIKSHGTRNLCFLEDKEIAKEILHRARKKAG